MKVRIDVLKAPWPCGAKVGDVVEVDHISPAFVGKCSHVSDDEEATVSFAKPEFVTQIAEGVDATSQEVAEALADAGDVVDVADAAQAAEPVQAKGKGKAK